MMCTQVRSHIEGVGHRLAVGEVSLLIIDFSAIAVVMRVYRISDATGSDYD